MNRYWYQVRSWVRGDGTYLNRRMTHEVNIHAQTPKTHPPIKPNRTKTHRRK